MSLLVLIHFSVVSLNPYLIRWFFSSISCWICEIFFSSVNSNSDSVHLIKWEGNSSKENLFLKNIQIFYLLSFILSEKLIDKKKEISMALQSWLRGVRIPKGDTKPGKVQHFGANFDGTIFLETCTLRPFMKLRGRLCVETRFMLKFTGKQTNREMRQIKLY